VHDVVSRASSLDPLGPMGTHPMVRGRLPERILIALLSYF
jgi:hypothetical protein